MENEITAERVRIARRLMKRASLGIALLLALFVGLVLSAACSLWFAWMLANAGGWVLALPWCVVALVCALAAWRCATCVFEASPAPIGVRLTPELAPSLYAFVERIGARFGGQRIDAIWITGDINAAVLQRPRWGLVGPMETHLLIGLPLAHSVSERQLGAIVAHEFGHIIYHGRPLAAWECHVRAWWFRAVENCIDRIPLVGELLDRITFKDVMEAQRLARLEEFEADRAAADTVGPRLVAETLVEVAAREQFLRCDFWVKVMAQCSSRPRPTVRPYRDMGSGMVAGFYPGSARSDSLQSMFAGDDQGDAFHPSLAERLEALGEVPEYEACVEDSVAERHLSLLLPRLAWELDRAWWQATRGMWRLSYLHARADS